MRSITKITYRRVRFLVTLACLLVVALAGASLAAKARPPQLTFGSPGEARESLIAAVQAKDHQKLAAIFGPVAEDMKPGDPVEEATEFQHFATHVAEGVEVVREGDNRATLNIGAKKWPFPIPLVKKGDRWIFDTAAGREEILNRRVGRNEIFAINVCRSYVQAQHEYYDLMVAEGDQVPKYAQHMISRPGKKDGLYWPTAAGEPESPLGPLVAKAKEEGYMGPRKAGEHGRRPFHGYYFKILKKQEKSAPGGKYSYVINGNMVAGHAFIAYPSRWGVSGVMTFIVNASGRVYEKNLGKNTAEIARKMKAYNPDQTWKLVPPMKAE
jgi:hypothetical protein